MISNNIAILPLLHCQKLSSNQSRQPATSTTSLHPRILPLHSFCKHRLIPLTTPKFHPTPARSDPRLSRCLCISLWFGSRCHPDRGAFFAPTRDLSSIPSSCPAASFSWAICRSGCPILRVLCGGWEPLTLSLPLLQSSCHPEAQRGICFQRIQRFCLRLGSRCHPACPDDGSYRGAANSARRRETSLRSRPVAQPSAGGAAHHFPASPPFPHRVLTPPTFYRTISPRTTSARSTNDQSQKLNFPLRRSRVHPRAVRVHSSARPRILQPTRNSHRHRHRHRRCRQRQNFRHQYQHQLLLHRSRRPTPARSRAARQEKRITQYFAAHVFQGPHRRHRPGRQRRQLHSPNLHRQGPHHPHSGRPPDVVLRTHPRRALQGISILRPRALSRRQRQWRRPALSRREI